VSNTEKTALHLACLVVLVAACFTQAALAEFKVGVKEGDWIEYKVLLSGNVPADHDVTWSRIEVIKVNGTAIDVKLTSRFSDGREETDYVKLNLETGEIGDAFIIPANLTTGDSFPERYQGPITISGVTERTYAGAARKVVYASTAATQYYWDQSTGILVEATSTYQDYSIASRAERTNMWQTQAFGLDPLFSIIAIVLAAAAILLVIRHKRK